MANAGFGQQFGRNDPDLSPEHDRVMFWLDEYVTQYMGRDRGMSFIADKSCEAADGDELVMIVKENKHMLGKIDYKIVWEKEIVINNRCVGFVDMMLLIRAPTLYVLDGAVRIEIDEHKICFEVKPRVYSIGELLRQMRQYRVWIPRAQFVAVAPLNEQQERVLRESQFWTINLNGGATCLWGPWYADLLSLKGEPTV
jgi:hypothetical protein